MAYARYDDPELAKAMYRHMNEENANELKKDLEDIFHYENGRGFLKASDDILMLLLFTQINLFGYLYKGSAKSVYAVEFIRKYLGKIDQDYAQVGGLLYDAIRHGTVHLATPKRIRLQDGKILDFLFIRSGRREDYLKIKKIPEAQRTGVVDIYRLTLDLPLLYRDLLSAIGKYIEDIRHNQGISDNFKEAFEQRRKPERAKEEELISKPYIQNSDFAFVREQISKL